MEVEQPQATATAHPNQVITGSFSAVVGSYTLPVSVIIPGVYR